MAYFPNGTAGMVFAEQCEECRYGQLPCPIAYAQMNWNYEAANNKVASEILNSLVKNNGDCTMFEMFEKDFKLTAGEKAQQWLFDELGTGLPMTPPEPSLSEGGGE